MRSVNTLHSYCFILLRFLNPGNEPVCVPCGTVLTTFVSLDSSYHVTPLPLDSYMSLGDNITFSIDHDGSNGSNSDSVNTCESTCNKCDEHVHATD